MAQPFTEPGRTSAHVPHHRGDAELRAFVDRFAHALTAGDTRTIAALWETPAYVLADDAVHDVRSIDEIEQFFNGARQQYSEQGIADTRPEVLRADWLTERIVTAHVRWPYLDGRGRAVGAEAATYTLRRDREGHLRLRVAVLHGVEDVARH
jgi:hypothetical protein